MKHAMGTMLRHCFFLEKEAFYDDLRPKYILPSLIADGTLTQDEADTVLSEDKYEHQTKKLIDVLSQKGSSVFESFVNALEKDYAYPWLAQKLLNQKKQKSVTNDITDNVSEDIYRCLTEGGVPFQTNYFFPRDNLTHSIRTELSNASGKRHWVVLHGMLGSGKSVIAAEAVRDAHLLNTYFSLGVCWISVGNIIHDSVLCGKMQSLWERIKPDEPFISVNNETVITNVDTIKKITEDLRRAIGKLDQKYLIILDDVWNVNVIEAFDVGCPILLTTKDKSVVDDVSCYCSFVDFGTGNEFCLNIEETKTFLSKFVHVESKDLPNPEISNIHSSCKGLPMVLSLVGSIMSPYGNKLERWKSLSEKLSKGISSALTGRHRRNSGKLTNANDAMELSIESLSDELKDYYKDLSVFSEDIPIPNKVLEIMWHLEKMDVEDIMHALYQKSLVGLEEDSETDGFLYSIHDFYLQFLKEKCTDVEDRHKRLVNRYLDLCKTSDGGYNYGLFPDDGYLHYFLGYHIFHAGMLDLFPRVFLDLNFIQSKLLYAGSSDLLYDFTTYKNYFNEVKEEQKDVENFIRRNAYLIYQDDADIIQLALFEPINSSVHKKAKEAALRNNNNNNNKKYLEWCNQADVPYSILLGVELSMSDLKCVAFHPQHNLVAVCGDQVLIWDNETGNVVSKLTGHSDTVNCCAFNPSGTLLVTGSNDKSVKLWKMEGIVESSRRSSKGRRHSYPSLTDIDNETACSPVGFWLHKENVLYCSFSYDGSRLVSSDADGTVYVSDCCTGLPIWHFHHCSDTEQSLKGHFPVNCCRFSHCGNRVATSSDCTIKIWNMTTKQCERILHQDEGYANLFFFSQRDTFIYSLSGSKVWKWNLGNSNIREVHNKVHMCNLSSLSLSPDEKYIATGTSNYSVVIWYTALMKPLAYLRGHNTSVESVVFSSDGSKLISASSDGSVLVWDMSKYVSTSVESLEANLSVQYHNKLTIASSDCMNRIQIRTGLNGTLKFKSVEDNNSIVTCCLSHDCSQVVYGTEHGSIKVLLLNNGEVVQYSSHHKQITFLMYIRQTLNFVSCSEDKTLRVWSDKVDFKILKGHRDAVTMCCSFNHSEKLLSCSRDGTLRVWDMSNCESVMVLDGHGNQNVTFCDISCDDLILCSASSDKSLRLWYAEHGQPFKTFLREECVRCCRFSPTDKLLIFGEDSGDVSMVDISIKNSSPSSLLGSHKSSVTDIRFSEDGSQFVSVSDSMKLWDKYGKIAQTIIFPGAFTCALWTSPDFKIFVLLHNSVLYILKTIS